MSTKGKEIEVTASVQPLRVTFTIPSVTARFKTGFAVQHLRSAAQFARMCHRIELENEGKKKGRFFDELVSFATAGIFLSVAAIEANLNEILDAMPRFGAAIPDSDFDSKWKKWEYKNLLKKHQFVLRLLDKPELATNDARYEDLDALVRMRNALVHYRPHWNDDTVGRHAELSPLLQRRFAASPFVGSHNPFFPLRCMSHACLSWAVQSGMDFSEEFSARSGLPFRFAKRRIFRTDNESFN